MAEIEADTAQLATSDDRVFVTTWTPVTNADTCEAIRHSSVRDRCLQVLGTFDSATVALHGSNDGTNYAALKDAGGSAIGLTAAGIVQVQQIPVWVKPVISGGGASQSLTIVLAERRGFR